MSSPNQLKEHFYKLIRETRWKQGIKCLFCGSENVKKNGKYHHERCIQRYYCKDCKKSFCDTTGTVFHYRKYSIAIAIEAIMDILVWKKSILEVASFCGIAYNNLYKFIRRVLKVIDRKTQREFKLYGKMKGEIEIDEFFMRSGLKGMRNVGQIRPPRRRGLKIKGRGTFDKDLIPCFLINERKSKTKRIFVAMHQDMITAKELIYENVEQGAVINTDEFDIYNFLDDTSLYEHRTCNHSKKEYARGNSHVNGCEGYTATLRIMMARHRGVNKYNLHTYLNSCLFASRVKKIGSGMKMIDYVIKYLVDDDFLFFKFSLFLFYGELELATN